MKTHGRIEQHPVLGSVSRRKEITFHFNGNAYQAFESETVAAALLANGIRRLRFHEENGTPRGIYCNIGHCFECRVTVDGIQGTRACLTLVKDGMVVRSGEMLPTPLKKGGHSA